MPKNGYFSNFPHINYNGQNVVDITARVIVDRMPLKNPYVSYPYEITDSERLDQFSNRYYGDPFYSWICLLSNEMIDPFYDWHVFSDDFDSFITRKYGSVLAAQTKIKYYENNWYSGGTLIPAAYDALPNSLFKYWVPVFDNYNNVMSYQRDQSNVTITTNGIRSYSVSNSSFIVDEIVNINFDFNANVVGNGQVMAVTNNSIYVQHITGTTTGIPSVNSFIYGQESGVNTAFTTAVNVCDNLLPEEQIYYSPVSYYDYENAKNESKKVIQVLDKTFAANTLNQLKKLMGTK